MATSTWRPLKNMLIGGPGRWCGFDEGGGGGGLSGLLMFSALRLRQVSGHLVAAVVA